MILSIIMTPMIMTASTERPVFCIVFVETIINCGLLSVYCFHLAANSTNTPFQVIVKSTCDSLAFSSLIQFVG